MEHVSGMMDKLRATESAFNAREVMKWHGEHAEVPVFAVCIYFVVVFWLPGVLEASNIKFKLSGLMILWNTLLATFSVFGASRLIPALYAGVTKMGYEESVCADAAWWKNGTSGFWVCLFVYSKIPELVDTLFLVLRRRPVILLHWFHHCTVLLYCWHAYLIVSGPGMWFATMNFTVHAIMYSYYAAMAARLGKFLTVIAPLITAIQILQMMGGMIIVVTACNRVLAGGTCAADPANLKLGFAMYFSYFILFFMLFWNKYVANPCKEKRPSDESSPRVLCGVDLGQTDTAGRFNDYGGKKTATNGKKKD